MIKKNPSYRITVYNQTETVIIEYPLTCQFNSQRGTFSQSNKCTIDIYNLAPSTRAMIFKDALTLDPAQWKYIKLEAGWDGQLSQIFMGRILQAYSTKGGGQVDVITHIECQPFDIFTTQSAYTFEAGTTYKDAYKTMAADMPNVEIGAIGTLEGTFKTQTTFEGNTLQCLNTLTGGNSFVDNGVINSLMGNEVLDVPVPVVTDENGLLNTPVRRDASLTIKMLFEPTLVVGQLLEVRSTIQPEYNGQYKVLGFTHDCLISPTQAGQRITTVDLWIAPLLTGTDINITGEAVTDGTASSFNKVKGEQITPGQLKEPNGVREVYLYLQRNNGQMPPTRITANITWKDMIGHSNTNAERKSECTIAVLTNCYYTAQQLQRVYNLFWKGRRLVISSGWRSKRNNRSCGGAVNSQHLLGKAVDFNLGQATIRKDYAQLKKVWGGFTLFEGTWIHADIRGYKGIANDK